MAMEMIKKCICRGSPSRETGTNGIKKEKWNHESWLVNHKEYQRELQRVSTTILAHFPLSESGINGTKEDVLKHFLKGSTLQT